MSKTANTSSVLSEAFRLHQVVRCSLAEEDPCQGGSHKVLKVVFEDSVQWAARLCHDPNNWKYELRAVKMFQHIKQTHPDIRAPSVFFKAEHPVLYSEWVTGKSLKVWNSQIPLNKRQTLLKDLAEFLLQLRTTAVPPDFMPEQKPRYSAWLTESLDRGLRRTLTGTARWGDAIDYLIMRSMIPKYAGDYDKYTDVGFVHGDLKAYNIIKDDDFHLTGQKTLFLDRSCSGKCQRIEEGLVIQQKPVKYPDNDLSPKYTLPDIFESQVSLNPRACANILLIDNMEFPNKLKDEDAAGYNFEPENNLLEQDHQEADYLEVEGFISDKTRYRAASIASDENHKGSPRELRQKHTQNYQSAAPVVPAVAEPQPQAQQQHQQQQQQGGVEQSMAVLSLGVL
ncbi:hypothetical protein COH20_001125 [Aspergillus flavus]|nr:hypothetical protein COH21_007508 [Aspergillus flavus]RAQ70812.1 hypothetical protein COH20_001125 [Aspergillus flavus]